MESREGYSPLFVHAFGVATTSGDSCIAIHILGNIPKVKKNFWETIGARSFEGSKNQIVKSDSHLL